MTPDNLEKTEKIVTSAQVAVRDIRQLGWCNPETSELVPGLVITPGI